MPGIVFLATVDGSGLNDILGLSMAWSKRAPEVVVNSTIFHVAKRARDYTPHVELGAIDAELGTAVTLQEKMRGSGFKKAKRTEVVRSGRTVPIARPGYSAPRLYDVPLAVAIIQASVRPGSRYNVLTQNRWKRGQSPFKGVSRAEGRMRMRSAENRLIKARHSSTHFLVAGWSFVMNETRKYFRFGAPPESDISPTKGGGNKQFGSFTPAMGGAICFAVIENRVGMGGSVNAEAYNQALQRYGGPALQQAVDEEALEKARIYAERFFNEALLPRLRRFAGTV